VKIRVTLTIELDPADWVLTHGETQADSPAKIREDVKKHVLAMVQQGGSFGNGDVPVEVTLS
jgi:hypothetical protein